MNFMLIVNKAFQCVNVGLSVKFRKSFAVNVRRIIT